MTDNKSSSIGVIAIVGLVAIVGMIVLMRGPGASVVSVAQEAGAEEVEDDFVDWEEDEDDVYLVGDVVKTRSNCRGYERTGPKCGKTKKTGKHAVIYCDSDDHVWRRVGGVCEHGCYRDDRGNARCKTKGSVAKFQIKCFFNTVPDKGNWCYTKYGSCQQGERVGNAQNLADRCRIDVEASRSRGEDNGDVFARLGYRTTCDRRVTTGTDLSWAFDCPLSTI